MNIGFLVNSCEPYYRGGYERRVATFAKACVRQGHRVRIFTSCPKDAVIDGVEYVSVAPVRPFFNSRGVRNVWADVLFVLHLATLFFKWRRKEMEILEVCATPFIHLPVLAWLAWWKGFPIVATCHEALLASLGNYALERGHGRFPGLSVFVFASLYKWGTGSVKHRIAVSEKTLRGLEQEGYPAEELNEVGLEPQYFVSPEPQDDSQRGIVRFIYCGRLTQIKQVAVAVEALLSVRKKRTDFSFAIIGTGSEETAIHQMVLEAKAGDWVTLHGSVSEAKKLELLQSSDAFLLSSPREGFSAATLEGMANGCLAVIINDPLRPNGALDFVIDGENGVVGEASPAGLTRALEMVLEMTPEVRCRYRKNAWKTARKYTIDDRAAAIVRYFERVIEEEKSRR